MPSSDRSGPDHGGPHHGGPDHTDMPAGSWVDRWLPPAARPYARLARLDRPIGTWLLLFPCWWALLLALPTVRETGADVGTVLWLGVLFALGALVMRGAGCTVNDIADREFDARVARTRTRPIASGAIPVRAALVFLAVLLLLGLAVLLQLNAMAVLVGALSLPLVVAYPFMKRITWWPQAFLGLTFNWGALVGWAAMTGGLALPALLLYAAGLFWTLGYDTIYAHQDKADDALIGVRSTARLLGGRSRGWILGFYAGFLALLAAAGAAAGLDWPFYPALAAVAAHLLWQVRRLQIDDPEACLRLFRANRDTGWLVLVALLLGQFPV